MNSPIFGFFFLIFFFRTLVFLGSQVPGHLIPPGGHVAAAASFTMASRASGAHFDTHMGLVKSRVLYAGLGVPKSAFNAKPFKKGRDGVPESTAL